SDPNTSFSPSSCSSVNLSTEADIKKRIGEYYQLFSYLDLVGTGEQVYHEILSNWNTDKAYQVNSCGNW
ncbi:hypothetical protein, partial [Gracilibacillus alcaliphilus]|uniref:hypothetical protein n=1 Tax=Gracilibacillus alcaliphilus TaxID=1401441 RepID=UPI0019596869